MRYDFVQLFTDYNVPYAIEGNKHCQKGWVQLRDCPFCEDKKYHFGINMSNGYANCWKCGHHHLEDTISEVLSVSYYNVPITLNKYKLRPSAEILDEENKTRLIRTNGVLKLPIGCGPMQKVHKDYLSGRDYDPDYLERTFNLMGTGPMGPYKFRVIAPVFFGGKMVSYQGRDITGRAPLPKKSCRKEDELRDHKHCLYGLELVKGDTIVIMEGPPGPWRFGPGAVATFGTSYMMQQVILMRPFKRRVIILDSEDKDPNAPKQAERLANLLSVFDGENIIVDLDTGDPGDVSQDDANAWMREWRKRTCLL
jgi:hypothetical protein